jgi:predicted CopG family antitoxin
MVIINNGEKTYIQISKEVADRLNQIKLVPRESYEDVLRRLLKMEKRIMKQKERGE